MEHRGYYRRRLPHIDLPDACQFLTFSLHGTRASPPYDFAGTHVSDRRGIVLPAGPRWLADARCAAEVEGALLFGHPSRYSLLGWVVMPNHVHCIIEQRDGSPLAKTVGDLKRFTAHRCNRILGRTGQFWALECWDRIVRTGQELERIDAYIRCNPVVAGLAAEPWEYRWGHAWHEFHGSLVAWGREFA